MPDLEAIANRAATAAADATSAAQAAKDAATAAQDEAGKRGLVLPPEVVSSIATASAAAVVGQLREIGAIREDPEPDPAPDPAPEPDQDPEGDPEPQTPKTFAHKFLGL